VADQKFPKIFPQMKSTLFAVAKFTYFSTFAVPVSLLISVTGIPLIINYVMRKRRLKRPPPPGKPLVLEIDYGTMKSMQQFYYNLSVPTPNFHRKFLIIFESACTLNSAVWFHLQRKLAKVGIPSLSYDRVGYGFSTCPSTINSAADRIDNYNLNRSPDIVAFELKCLLAGLGLNEKDTKLILCGHALGGLFVRSLDVKNVKAFVLCDYLSPDMVDTKHIWLYKFMRYFTISGMPLVLTWIPFFWNFLFLNEKSSGAVLMTDKETDLFRKDSALIVDNILSSDMWKVAEEESRDCSEFKLRDFGKVPVHFYVAGLVEWRLFNMKTKETRDYWLKQQKQLFQELNEGIDALYFLDEEIDQMNIPFSPKFFDFLLHVYGRLEDEEEIV
jgi:pimeloyl-ACP methyl ester carboxylesterase